MESAAFNTGDGPFHGFSGQELVHSEDTSHRIGNKTHDRMSGVVDMHIYSPEPTVFE